MNLRTLCTTGLLWLAGVPAIASVLRQDPAPAKPETSAQGAIPECKAMTKTASGLEWGVLAKGRDEPPPGADDIVSVQYTGWLTDGTRFDGTRDAGRAARFIVKSALKGFAEGLQLMAPGAHYKLVVPGDLAYGAHGRPPLVGSDATLVFEIELLDITRMPKWRPANPDAQQTTGNGIKWEVIQKGQGAAASPTDGVSLRFAYWNPAGVLVECSEKNNNQYVSGTMTTLQPQFLRDVVASWRVGEIQRLEVPKQLVENAQMDTIWEVELVRVNKVPAFRAGNRAKTVTTQSGLLYEVVEMGTGPSPKMSDIVLVHYTGWLQDGTLFDSSHARGEPWQSSMRRMMPGWTEGVQLMKVGSTFLFTIPADLAYGASGRPPVIPANATLVFLIELVEIKK
ncbi:MAG: FKBP-type peptidyl-prolyl cis-trans isomerase [Planctomycetota bacterium]